MSSQAITVQDNRIQSIAQVERDQKAIWELMAKVMKPGEDYGLTPGSKKPSLYKPGSEKILSMFKLAVDILVEDVQTTSDIGRSGISPRYTEYRVRVYVTVKEMSSGRFIGKGVGECSSYEEKYLWRKAVSKAEYEHFNRLSEDYCRIKFGGYYDKDKRERVEYEEFQVRVPTADRMNTVVKMAKKRGQIDACLTATAASAIFTQDLEDMEAYLREAIEENQEQGSQEQEPPKNQRPQRKSKAAKQEATAATNGNEPKQDAKPERERDKDCITQQQEKMLWAISRNMKLSEQEVKDKMRAEFKNKAGQPLEHSYDMLKTDFQAYLDSIDPEMKHHYKQ